MNSTISFFLFWGKSELLTSNGGEKETNKKN